MPVKKITVQNILDKKGKKIKMLTAYDYPMAKLIDASGVDLILVGDSLANVALGLDSTKEVGMPEMIHHAKAVVRAVERAIVVGDLPYGSYRNKKTAVQNAKKFLEVGCRAVKLEWFDRCAEVAKAIFDAGIPVMGHVGLTPQTAENFKVQGKDAKSAKDIIDHALALEASGCFSVVLECIPSEIARIITECLKIPTIGIGAGVHCDGQVLVTHDLLGLYSGFHPKFAKRYNNLDQSITQSLKTFCSEVETGKFPGDEHSFTIDPKQLNQLQTLQ
ncbi:MAG: 3-methyl-2-oxobutanoate hydroxymethyltransferase [Candidatus Omnitrophica bacterium]|nr:3-methyl-2-oxobutanoate hydroxymethyltransferase [Candidatus Omnitrophota bacterium]